MNVERLLAVKAAILARPEAFDMETFVASETPFAEADMYAGLQRGDCGTTGCIAGWAIALFATPAELRSTDTIFELLPDELAADLLDLEYSSACALFYHDETGWPNDLYDAYCKADNPLSKARIAAERIDRFIAEHAE